MAGIEVVEVEEEEFLALEECLGAAERQAAAGKGQQGKRVFEASECTKETELVPTAKMPCTARQQGMLLSPLLPHLIQQPQQWQRQKQRLALPSDCMRRQKQPHQAQALQDNSNQHNSCIRYSSVQVSQLQRQHLLGADLQQQKHGHLKQQHQHTLQHSAYKQQSSLYQAACLSMPVPTVGLCSAGSATLGLQRQQSAPTLDSGAVQQQQQRLPIGKLHQQQLHQSYRLQQPPQQQHGQQEWQQAQNQKHNADQPAARQTAHGVAHTTAAAAGGSSGSVPCHCQAGLASVGTCVAGSCTSSNGSAHGTGSFGKCMDQHGKAAYLGQVNSSATADECCAGSGGHGQHAAGGDCVAGVLNSQATAAHSGVGGSSAAGSGHAPAVSSLPPDRADAQLCCAGRGSNLGRAHDCSSGPVPHTQVSGEAAQWQAAGVAGSFISGSCGAGAAAVSDGRQADRCNSSGTGAACSSGSGSSSRRLPASLANSQRSTAAAAAARGQQVSGARIQPPGQQQQAQQGKLHQQQQTGPQKPLQLEYHGQVRYAYQLHEVDWLCQQLLDAGPPGVVGFDLEWRPTYRRGCAPNKTALLQLAYAMDKHGKDGRPTPDGKGVMVLLLHVLYSGITSHLQSILSREDIIKVGVNISGDANKLLADFNVAVESTSELSDVANGRQLSCVDGITSNIEHKRWSLAGLVQEVMCVELPKPNDIRCGNWERVPLEKDQQRYAAMDAFACLLLHWEMQDLPERLTLSQQLRQRMMQRAAAAAAGCDDD